MIRRLGDSGRSNREERLFTNRVHERTAVWDAVNQPDGSPLPVIAFHGVGGAGKSQLMRQLAREFAKGGVPFARLDLDPSTGGEGYHADPPKALMAIRRQLEVACPRFDVAHALRRFKLGDASAPNPRGATVAGKALDAGEQIASALLSGVPGGNILVWLGKQATAAASWATKDTTLGRWIQSKTGSEFLVRLRSRSAEDLYESLSGWLIDDLAEALPQRPGKACRAVIMLDTFEAIRRGEQGTAEANRREEWVQQLYAQGSPVLLVLAGRDRIRWGEHDEEWNRVLSQHLVGGLSRIDAEALLQKNEITDKPLVGAILGACLDVQTADMPDHGYHAYAIALCADAVLGERAAGRPIDAASFAIPPGKLDALADRFLSSLHSPADEAWITKLALTPRFDRDAAARARSDSAGAMADAAWGVLERFSFLTPTDRDGWYTLHARMTESLVHRSASTSRSQHNAWHAWWKAYWESRCATRTPDPLAEEFAFVHSFVLDPVATAARAFADDAKARGRADSARQTRWVEWWDTVRAVPEPWGPRASAEIDHAQGTALIENPWRSSQADRARAVACLRDALTVFNRETLPQDWAKTKSNLACALRDQAVAAEGQRCADLLSQAVANCDEALTVFTREALPQSWARTKNTLAIALSDQALAAMGPQRADLLGRAVAAYFDALTVFTREKLPRDWAMIKNNLATALRSLSTASQGLQRAVLLGQAVAAYCDALSVYTRESLPQAWAATKNNLAIALRDQAAASEGHQRAQMLEQAVAAYREALTVYTREALPQDWARTQNNLAIALSDQAEASEGLRRADLLAQAVAAYRETLTVHTRETLPQDWAMTQNNLAVALSKQAAASEGPQRADLLGQTVAAIREALTVFTRDALPQDWATSTNNLAVVLSNQAAASAGPQRADLLDQSVAAYRDALTVRTREALPLDWAMTMNNLAIALSDQAKASEGTRRAELLGQVVAVLREALTVYTREALPQDWAMTQNSLAIALRAQAAASEVPQRPDLVAQVVDVYRETLTVYTRDALPQDWAMTQNNLANALVMLAWDSSGAARERLLREAIEAYDAALTIYTAEHFPSQHAEVRARRDRAPRLLES